MFETLGEKAEEKAMVQFLERFTDDCDCLF